MVRVPGWPLFECTCTTPVERIDAKLVGLIRTRPPFVLNGFYKLLMLCVDCNMGVALLEVVCS